MVEFLSAHWAELLLGLAALQGVAAVVHKRYPDSLADDVFGLLARLSPADIRGLTGKGEVK